MTTIQAIKFLIERGAANPEKLVLALQAINMKSPVADARALRAISDALAHGGRQSMCLTHQEHAAIGSVMAQLAGHPMNQELCAVVGWALKSKVATWKCAAQKRGLSLWDFVEKTLDDASL
jgi:hypothetical protein